MYAIRTELELHVDVPLVLETVLERNDVWVLHCLVNLDFGKELYRIRYGSVPATGEEGRGGKSRESQLTLDFVFVDFSCCLSTTLRAL